MKNLNEGFGKGKGLRKSEKGWKSWYVLKKSKKLSKIKVRWLFRLGIGDLIIDEIVKDS